MKTGTHFEFEKDRFRKGEYSIYKRTYRDGKVSSETYLFGTARKYDAMDAVKYLNGKYPWSKNDR